MPKKNGLGLLFALLSGLLLNLIFPRWELDFLAWVALIPLFCALAGSKSFKNSFFLGLSCGLVTYFGSCFWITNTMINYAHLPFGLSLLLLFLLAFYMSLYVAAFSGFFFFARESFGLFPALTLSPFSWCFLEYIRTFLFTGFPWNLLGYSQYKNLHLIQIADITGIYGVSFLICLMNAFLFFGLLSLLASKGVADKPDFPRWGAKFFSAFVAIAIILVFVYGNHSLNRTSPVKKEDSLKISLVQGNILQDKKWDPVFKDEILQVYEDLTRDSQKLGSELVVWPETSLPFFFNAGGSKTEKIIDLAKESNLFLLMGSASLENLDDEIRLANSAYLISGKGELMGRYDKVKLVPFGEYVPLKKLLWFVEKMVVGIGNFLPGKAPEIMELPKGRFGTLICFEIIFPGLARWNREEGAQFLVNITNDAWFGESAGPYQHLSQVVFRAIENRIPIVRAANTGISAMITSKGEIASASQIFVRKTVTGEIFPSQGSHSFYTKYGDIFTYLCGSVVLGFFAVRFRLKPKRLRNYLNNQNITI